MLTFRQFLQERLSDLALERQPISTKTHLHPETGKVIPTPHVWHINHPEYGHVATVTMNSNTDLPMHQTHSAAMTIETHKNPKIPKAEVHGVTRMGPKYEFGPAVTKNLLRTIRSHYPALKEINKSPRLTGARREQSLTDRGKLWLNKIMGGKHADLAKAKEKANHNREFRSAVLHFH